MVTAFYGVLDPVTGALTYCNAGHPPPYLFRAARGSEALGLAHTGMALGVFENLSWERGTVQIAPGDALVLYTDGITEAINQQAEMFDVDRLQASVRRSLGRPAREVLDQVLADVHVFAGGALQSDDIAMIVLVREAGAKTS
jgi:sigma-B regulation protein RsbU (phosphoserine phosphatase)